MATPERDHAPRPLALVTGASTGIGYALARCCAERGFDLIVAADEPAIAEAAEALGRGSVSVMAVEADLATNDGVERVCAAAAGRPVEALLANAGRGLGGAFLDQPLEQVRRVVDTNVSGTLHLVHRIGRDMRRRGGGRILITGSIIGLMPGAYQAVYGATKAFLDSFAYALREELRGSGVSVTCLMPGATDTAFFDRAGMQRTKLAASGKDDPAGVARRGFDAMMRGEAGVVSGWQNRLKAAIATLTPSTLAARGHARLAKPRSRGND